MKMYQKHKKTMFSMKKMKNHEKLLKCIKNFKKLSFLAKYIRKTKIHIKTQFCTQEKKTILIFTEIYENAITSRKNMRIPTNI